jgi:hypothetical protein
MQINRQPGLGFNLQSRENKPLLRKRFELRILDSYPDSIMGGNDL